MNKDRLDIKYVILSSEYPEELVEFWSGFLSDTMGVANSY